MKRKLVIFVIISALISCMVTPALALSTIKQNVISTEKELHDDGSYAIIETVIIQPNISTLATNTKTASRTYTYYASNDVKEWSFTVQGTFSYTGSSAKATNVTASHKIYVDGWSCSSKDTSKSGATVSATGKFKYKLLTKTTTIGLKCSNTGVISAL